MSAAVATPDIARITVDGLMSGAVLHYELRLTVDGISPYGVTLETSSLTELAQAIRDRVPAEDQRRLLDRLAGWEDLEPQGAQSAWSAYADEREAAS